MAVVVDGTSMNDLGRKEDVIHDDDGSKNKKRGVSDVIRQVRVWSLRHCAILNSVLYAIYTVLRPGCFACWNGALKPALSGVRPVLVNVSVKCVVGLRWSMRTLNKAPMLQKLGRRRARQISAWIILVALLLFSIVLVHSVSFLFGSRTEIVAKGTFHTRQHDARIKARLEAEKEAHNNDLLEDALEARLKETLSKDFEKEFGHRLGQNNKEEEEEEEEEEEHEKDEEGTSTIEKKDGNPSLFQMLTKSFKTPEEKSRKKTPIRVPLAKIKALRKSRKYVSLKDVSESAEESMGRSSRRKRSKLSTISEAVPSVEEVAIRKYGYAEASLSDPNLLWLVGPQLMCQGQQFTKRLNQVTDRLKVITMCNGDSKWVNRAGDHSVLDERLRRFESTKLARIDDCMKTSDFIPSSLTVTPVTDLSSLERDIAEIQDVQGVQSFIIKHAQKDIHDKAAPEVTEHPLKTLRHMRKDRRARTELVVQAFKKNALLWDERKFTIRTWAVVVSSEPLIVMYHDGVVLRSLEKSILAHTKKSQKYSKRQQYADINTRQSGHHDYTNRREDAFGCIDELQTYLSGSFASTEMRHFSELILVPELQRLMLAVIHAHRRDTPHPGVWNMQRISFDFILDANWNIWLVDTDWGTNDVNLGEDDFTSPCKRSLIQALGDDTIHVTEQLIVKMSKGQDENLLNGIDRGSLQVLWDASDSSYSFSDRLCKRSTYQDFRDRQTFSKRAIQTLLKRDGRPPKRSSENTKDGEPWKCPVCGYLNDHHAHSCENCGGPHLGVAKPHPFQEPTKQQPVRNFHDHGSRRDFDSRDGRGFDPHETRPNIDSSYDHQQQEHNGFHAPKDEFNAYFRQERERNTIHNTHEGHNMHTEFSSFFEQQRPNHENVVENHDSGTVISCGGKQFSIKENVQGFGTDIETLRTSTLHTCCASCAMNPGCYGYTFDRSTFQCHLKTQITAEGYARATTLGILDASFPVEHNRNRGVGPVGQTFQGYRDAAFRHDDNNAFSKREKFRKQLVDIFMDHDPAKVAKVDILLDRYRGKEEKYIQQTLQQYEAIDRLQQERSNRRIAAVNDRERLGPSQNRFRSSQAAPTRDSYGLTVADYRERLEQIFQQHDPQMASQLDTMLERFKGKEMDLLQYLVEKYK